MPPIIDKIEQRHKNIKDNKPEWIVIHHSLSPATQTFATIKDYHIRVRKFDTIGYHYLITNDGTIYQGRPDLMHGAHCVAVNEPNVNARSIGICLVGNFDKYMPTPAQITSLKSLLRVLIARYSVPLEKIVPHRHFLGKPPYKSCFGLRLSDDWAQDLISEDIPPVIPPVLNIEEIKVPRSEVLKLIDYLKKLL